MKKDKLKNITTYLWQVENLPGMDFNRTQYYEHQFAPHFHEHYVIQLVEQGVNKCICDRKNYQIEPGGILIINPNEIHTGNSFDNRFLEYKSLCPTMDCMKLGIHKLQELKSGLPAFGNAPIYDKLLVQRFKQLFLMTKNNKDKLELETAFIDFLGYLINKFSDNGYVFYSIKNEKCRVEKIKNFIRDNYGRNFSLDELSQFAMVSPYHLIRIFKKEVGMTPFEYLRNYRVEKAKEMLREKRSIMDAIYDNGFYDQSHFIRHFKNVTGVTPKVYA